MTSLKRKKILLACMVTFIVISTTVMILYPTSPLHEDELLIEVINTEAREYGTRNGKVHFHHVAVTEITHLATKETTRMEFVRDGDYNIYFPNVQHHLPDFIKARRVTDQGLYLRLQMSIDQEYVSTMGDRQALRTRDRRLRTAFGF